MSNTSAANAQTPAAATDIPVLVPRRADNGRRDEIWEKLRKVWETDGWRVVEGHHDGPGDFNRSAALNTAATLAGDWELAVIADADSLVAPEQLRLAVDLAATSKRLVIAHDRWINIPRDRTDDFLRARALEHDPNLRQEHLSVSSMLVVPRTVWDTVRGFDERHVGWGSEDRSFHRACEVLTGPPLRVMGICWHLAHDRTAQAKDRNHPAYRANRALYLRYRQAATPRRMRALIGER